MKKLLYYKEFLNEQDQLPTSTPTTPTSPTPTPTPTAPTIPNVPTTSGTTIPTEDNFTNPKTFGDLKKLISNLITTKRTEATKSAGKKFLVKQLIGLIPGGSMAKSAFDVFKSIYDATGNVQTKTWLDKINVDDNFAAIVDNGVENAFIKEIQDWINQQPDDTPLPEDFNMNQRLIDFLSRKYHNRTLSNVSIKNTK